MIPYSRKLRIKKPIAADLEGPVAMALGAQKLEERGLAWVIPFLDSQGGNIYTQE